MCIRDRSGREYKCCKKQQKTDWSNSFKYYTDDTVDCAEHAVAGRNLLSGNCILCGNHEFIGIDVYKRQGLQSAPVSSGTFVCRVRLHS